MNTLLRLEETAKMLLAYFATLYLDFAWWVFFAWLLAPDLSMIGYLLNTRIGAWLYNLVHHQAFAIAILVIGFYMPLRELQLAGLVLFGHSSMDRIFGYGLKYADDFKHTHMGWIGKR